MSSPVPTTCLASSTETKASLLTILPQAILTTRRLASLAALNSIAKADDVCLVYKAQQLRRNQPRRASPADEDNTVILLSARLRILGPSYAIFIPSTASHSCTIALPISPTLITPKPSPLDQINSLGPKLPTFLPPKPRTPLRITQIPERLQHER